MRFFKDIEYVEKIGQSCSKIDIIYKYNYEDVYRGIQVKKLTINKDRKDFYYCRLNGEYNDDTLLVGVNKDKNRFILIFKKDCTSEKSLSISFLSSSYKNNKFTDFKTFKKNLHKLSKESTIYKEDEFLSENCLKERQSLKRLEKKIKELRITYKNNKTHSSVYDSFINNHSIQHKYSSRKGSINSVAVSLHKYDYTLNNKINTKPYEISDNIDFFIFEIEERLNNFYIIPSSILIEKKYLRSETIKGKESINFVPDEKKKHWVSEFYNRFDLLC